MRRIDRNKLAKSSRTKRCKMTVGHTKGSETQMALSLSPSLLAPSPSLSSSSTYLVDHTQRPIVSREILPFPSRSLIYINIREVVDRAAISGRGRWRYEKEAKDTRGQRVEKLEKRTKLHGEVRRELYERRRKIEYVKWDVAEAKRTVHILSS